MGEFIGPYAEKKRKNPKSYLPRRITDKEEKEILNSVKIKAVKIKAQEQEEDDQPPKKPITELLTTETTTTRPKVKDILTGSGVT